MAALPDDAVAEFFKNAHRILMPDSGKLGHNSNGDFGFAHFEKFGFVRFGCQPFADGFLNVG